jgi:hypothetical protein
MKINRRDIPPECACGCGNKVTWHKNKKKWNMFIHGHSKGHSKNRPYKTLLKSPPQLCECGCGEMTKPGNKYIVYHHMRGKDSPTKRPEVAKKISKTMKMKGLTGEKNPNWKGGVSKFPYRQDWTKELKEYIRKRDNNRCQLCFKHQSELKRKLTLHHIDYDKQNCSNDNLISLCIGCHGKTNTNRDKWRLFFNQYKKLKNIIDKKMLKI